MNIQRPLESTNFRHEFGKLDPSAFMTPSEVGTLIAAPSVQAVYLALKRKDLPEPLIRRNRQIRWTVGQIREHLQRLEREFQERMDREAIGNGFVAHEVLGGKVRGRPRKGPTA